MRDVPLDEFSDDDIDQIRVPELNEFGIYQQRVFRRRKHEWVVWGLLTCDERGQNGEPSHLGLSTQIQQAQSR